MGRNKVLLSCLMLVAMLITSAQDRYMVFFSDKANVGYSIDHPEEFLTARAIARRAKHGIAITEQDLPVDPIVFFKLTFRRKNNNNKISKNIFRDHFSKSFSSKS